MITFEIFSSCLIGLAQVFTFFFVCPAAGLDVFATELVPTTRTAPQTTETALSVVLIMESKETK